ncbi:hypothetical protein C0583_04380 [Candidatus Parcubacteria bacterium]|nr:MAG: hypothetical protein C0583_04380 [Candidatus Parcubacteria bacterium]
MTGNKKNKRGKDVKKCKKLSKKRDKKMFSRKSFIVFNHSNVISLTGLCVNSLLYRKERFLD